MYSFSTLGNKGNDVVAKTVEELVRSTISFVKLLKRNNLLLSEVLVYLSFNNFVLRLYSFARKVNLGYWRIDHRGLGGWSIQTKQLTGFILVRPGNKCLTTLGQQVLNGILEPFRCADLRVHGLAGLVEVANNVSQVSV